MQILGQLSWVLAIIILFASQVLEIDSGWLHIGLGRPSLRMIHGVAVTTAPALASVSKNRRSPCSVQLTTTSNFWLVESKDLMATSLKCAAEKLGGKSK